MQKGNCCSLAALPEWPARPGRDRRDAIFMVPMIIGQGGPPVGRARPCPQRPQRRPVGRVREARMRGAPIFDAAGMESRRRRQETGSRRVSNTRLLDQAGSVGGHCPDPDHSATTGSASRDSLRRHCTRPARPHRSRASDTRHRQRPGQRLEGIVAPPGCGQTRSISGARRGARAQFPARSVCTQPAEAREEGIKRPKPDV